MREVTVAAAVYTVVSGIIGITGAQAKTRAHNLKAVHVDKKTGDGEYEVLRPVQFKRGEKLGYSGEVAKNGLLHDPEAEQIARLEASDDMRRTLRAEYDTKVKELRGQLAAKVEAAKGEFVAALLLRLPEDVTPALLKAIDEMKGAAETKKK